MTTTTTPKPELPYVSDSTADYIWEVAIEYAKAIVNVQKSAAIEDDPLLGQVLGLMTLQCRNLVAAVEMHVEGLGSEDVMAVVESHMATLVTEADAAWGEDYGMSVL